MIFWRSSKAELAEDVRDVAFHRSDAHDKLTGDPMVGHSLRHERQHLALAVSQVVDRAVEIVDGRSSS